jgi:hypothetical protein
MTLFWYAVGGVLLFCLGFSQGHKMGFLSGLTAAERDSPYRLGLKSDLKCDFFFSYPGERCRLHLGHEGRHVPPVFRGGGL